MTIIRGYSFLPTELVTDRKLYNLVAQAQFTNISWGSFLESGVAAVNNSSASGGAVGGIWPGYEGNGGLLTTSTYSGMWSDFNLFIQAPQGAVALFRQNALETNLMFNGDGTTAIPPGAFCQPGDNNFGTGVTLHLRPAWGAGGSPHRSPAIGGLGSTWQTANTAPSISAWVRTTLVGVAIMSLSNLFVTPTLPFPWYTNLEGTGGQVSKFTSSAASTAFYAFGLLLETKRAGGGLGWLFGGPVERTG